MCLFSRRMDVKNTGQIKRWMQTKKNVNIIITICLSWKIIRNTVYVTIKLFLQLFTDWQLKFIIKSLLLPVCFEFD